MQKIYHLFSLEHKSAYNDNSSETLHEAAERFARFRLYLVGRSYGTVKEECEITVEGYYEEWDTDTPVMERIEPSTFRITCTIEEDYRQTFRTVEITKRRRESNEVFNTDLGVSLLGKDNEDVEDDNDDFQCPDLSTVAYPASGE